MLVVAAGVVPTGERAVASGPPVEVDVLGPPVEVDVVRPPVEVVRGPPVEVVVVG